MDVEMAEELFRFARWEACLFMGILGFGLALRWLCVNVETGRRRLSAVIDLLWTSLSVIGIVSALVIFGELTWKAHTERHTEQMRIAWDKLAEIDGAKLVELNCEKGRLDPDALRDPLPGDMAVDSPCLRASQILRWRTAVDLGIAKIKKACPARDLKFSTREYEWTKDTSVVSSCSGTTECHRARCEQERTVFQILSTTERNAGKPLTPDPSLSAYRSSLQEALKVSLHEIYERTHPIKYTVVFYILVPFWAFFLGARLARSAAEVLDPTQKIKYCASWRAQKSTSVVPSPQAVNGAEPSGKPTLALQSGTVEAPAADSVEDVQGEVQP